MNSVDLIYDYEQSVNFYKEYLAFKRKQGMKSFPFVVVFGIGITKIIFAVVLKHSLMQLIGIIVAIIPIILVIAYLIRFQIYSKQILQHLETFSHENGNPYQFSFNQSFFKTENDHSISSMNWKDLNSFEINSNVIYLYQQKDILLDIIAIDLIGEENFNAFLEILRKNQIPDIT